MESFGGVQQRPQAAPSAARPRGGVLAQLAELESCLGLDGEGRPPLQRLDELEAVIGITPSAIGMVPRLQALSVWAKSAEILT